MDERIAGPAEGLEVAPGPVSDFQVNRKDEVQTAEAENEVANGEKNEVKSETGLTRRSELGSIDFYKEEIVVEESPAGVRGNRHPNPHRFGFAHGWVDAAESLLKLLVFTVFVLTFLFQPFRIPSESMERTLLVGDFLLLNKQIYGPPGWWGWLLPYRQPEQGDLIVFRFPPDPKDHLVKRIVGAPGDRIYLRHGIVYRNGEAVSEPYTRQPYPVRADAFQDNFPDARLGDPGVDAHWWAQMGRSISRGELVVPRGRFFVMGDNRSFSRDSRYWGFVPRASIVGMPMLIYFSVRSPSPTDRLQPAPNGPRSLQDDRLGNSAGQGWMSFARWDRILRVVH